MATTAQRRLATHEVRQFGSGRETHTTPDLTEIQTKSYSGFLQYGCSSHKRKDEGLESVLREIFPIESYDKTLSLDYLRYELGIERSISYILVSAQCCSVSCHAKSSGNEAK